jgi:hypothetical protein
MGMLTADVQGFATYYPAVLFAALFGGLAVGIFAIVLGGVISWWAFLPPYFVFSPLTSGQAISLLSYLFGLLCGRQNTIAGLRRVSKMKRTFVNWPSRSSHTD